MDYYLLIKKLYPTIQDHEFELGHNDLTEIQINKWNFSGTEKPAIEYLQSFKDKTLQLESLQNAAIVAQQYLIQTDYMAIRINEGYVLDVSIKQSREDARNAIRDHRDFILF